MYDMRLIDGFQGASKIILNGNFSQAMSLSRFTVNKKNDKTWKRKLTYIAVLFIYWINIEMTKTNIVLSNILWKKKEKKQTHNDFFKYFIL